MLADMNQFSKGVVDLESGALKSNSDFVTKIYVPAQQTSIVLDDILNASSGTDDNFDASMWRAGLATNLAMLLDFSVYGDVQSTQPNANARVVSVFSGKAPVADVLECRLIDMANKLADNQPTAMISEYADSRCLMVEVYQELYGHDVAHRFLPASLRPTNDPFGGLLRPDDLCIVPDFLAGPDINVFNIPLPDGTTLTCPGFPGAGRVSLTGCQEIDDSQLAASGINDPGWDPTPHAGVSYPDTNCQR
jgi:hypothetical protein